MTITIDIAPDVQAELARQAEAKGCAIEEHAARVLDSAVHVPARTPRMTPERLEFVLREMAQFSHKIPLLPDEAFTRESMYQDHD